jgi:predicted RNA-binding protein YlxR (DUF448 family)
MKTKPAKESARHVPQRTCIACRQICRKRELIRLVCLPDNTVEVDLTGKKSGRGAYLCPQKACWESALKTGKLEYALRTSLKPENKEKLVNYCQGLDNNNELSA